MHLKHAKGIDMMEPMCELFTEETERRKQRYIWKLTEIKESWVSGESWSTVKDPSAFPGE